MRKITVDGMLSGTGIRDEIAGGYVSLSDIDLDDRIADRIRNWLSRYENAHYYQFSDKIEVKRLDEEGVELANEIKNRFPQWEVSYFSNADMRKIPLRS